MRARVACLLLSAAGFLAAQPCQLPRLTGQKTFPAADAVRYCAPQKLGIRNASYQFLVDDSGSMRGFAASLPDLSAWVEQALRHVLRLEMSWSKSRECYFSAARPLAGCTAPRLRPSSFRGSADTSLDAAILSAKDYDLTIILTDGVGASSTPTPACASGVDAACVGRSLAETLQPSPGEPVGLRGGVWLVPLFTQYSGPFFTEQRFSPSAVDPARIRDSVAKEIRTAVEARSFRTDRNGMLFYKYSGPRALFLIVLARRTDLGRAFLAALQARGDYSRITRISNLSEHAGGISVLPSIELFPGAAHGLRWTRLQVAQPACVTFDARLQPDGKLALACSNPRDEAVITLSAAAPPESLDCARLLNLPLLRTELRPDPQLGAIRNAAWKGSGLSSSDPLRLTLHLSCSNSWQSRLSSCLSAGTILSRRDLPGTIEALLGARPGNQASALIRSISSSSVIYTPHRAFQLAETLERFFRTIDSVEPAPRPVELGKIDLCWMK